MALPFNIPYTFATATGSVPLSQLDNNFTTVVQAVNAIGNGSNALSNVTISGGTIANVTISSLVGPLSPTLGGTGLTSPGASGNVLASNGSAWVSQAGALPSVANNAGKVLGTDGSTTSWRSTLVPATAQTSTATNIDFTGIPSWAKRVTVVFSQLSTDASTGVLLRLGVGGSFVTTGYTCHTWQGGAGNTGATSTTGFLLDGGGQDATTSRNGSIVLHNVSSNIWVANGLINLGQALNVVNAMTGRVSLSGVLDSVRLVSGTGNLFDNGTVNIFWE